MRVPASVRALASSTGSFLPTSVHLAMWLGKGDAIVPDSNGTY